MVVAERVHLARHLVGAGQHARATRIANSFSALVRDRVLVDLVEAACGGDDLPAAERMAHLVSAGPIRGRALACCARPAISLGDLGRAVSIVLTIPDVAVRTEVAISILRRAAAAGNLDVVRRIVDWAEARLEADTRPGERRHAARVLVAARAANGDFVGGQDTGEATTDADERDLTTVMVIGIAAWRGDRAEVDRLLAGLGTPAAVEWAREEMVSAAIATGDLTWAVELAESLSEPGLRDQVLVEIAAAASGSRRLDLLAVIVDNTRTPCPTRPPTA